MRTITTSDELRMANRARVLAVLRESGQLSRKRIGELTSTSAATVTLVTAELIDDGLVKELSPTSPASKRETGDAKGRGRPRVLLDLQPSACTVAVVTVLLNRIEVTLFDYAGVQLQQVRKRLVTRRLSSSTLNKHLCAALDSCLSDKKHRLSLKHIVLACQGTVSSEAGILLWSPIFLAMDLDLRSALVKRYGVAVSVDNDCNMIATALCEHGGREMLDGFCASDTESAGSNLIGQGAGNRSHRDFAAVLLSYGIGLGFFHRGSVVTGSHSSGTEFGHMIYQADGALCRCGRSGCIEAYASDYAIWRHAQGHSATAEPVDKIPGDGFQQIIDKAKASPGIERDAFDRAGTALGQGLANLFAIFDPFPIVLIGRQNTSFELLQPAMIKALGHSVKGAADDYIHIYDEVSDTDLVRLGACWTGLSYVDKWVFGFGEKKEAAIYAN